MTNSEEYMNNYTDSELMNLVKERNSKALTILYTRYNNSVYNFIIRYTGSREIAEDVLQETFTRIWYAAHTFNQKRGNFKAWLFTIGLNITRNEMTKKRYSYHYVEMEDVLESNVTLQNRDENHPETISNKNEMKKLVAEALGRMKQFHREIIILKHYQKLKFREIAEITNTPIGTLKARFHNAIAQLKNELKGVEL